MNNTLSGGTHYGMAREDRKGCHTSETQKLISINEVFKLKEKGMTLLRKGVIMNEKKKGSVIGF